MIAGTDAHAKNYSLLIGANGQVRLAPVYDIASAYAYPHFQAQKLKLAMKIGSKYKIQEIDRRSWQAFAREAHLEEAELRERAKTMAAAIPDEFAKLRAQAARQRIKHPALERLQTALAQQCARCTAALG